MAILFVDCEVPHGKAIFIPITVGWQSVAENQEFRGRPVNEIRDSLIKGKILLR